MQLLTLQMEGEGEGLGGGAVGGFKRRHLQDTCVDFCYPLQVHSRVK